MTKALIFMLKVLLKNTINITNKTFSVSKLKLKKVSFDPYDTYALLI